MAELSNDSAQKKKLYAKSQRKKLLDSATETAALLCYYYPQYTLEDTLVITSGEVDLMIKVAKRKELTDRMIQLSMLGAATNKKSYTKLQNDFKKGMERLK